jgi:hypothetical protein
MPIKPGAIKCSFSTECSVRCQTSSFFTLSSTFNAPFLAAESGTSEGACAGTKHGHAFTRYARIISCKMHTGLGVKMQKMPAGNNELRCWEPRSRHQQLPAAPSELTRLLTRTGANDNEYYGLVNYAVLNFHWAFARCTCRQCSLGLWCSHDSQLNICTLAKVKCYSIANKREKK